MKVRCIKDVIMTRDQTREFTTGKIYEMDMQGYATNDSGDPNHEIGGIGSDFFNQHFKEIKQNDLYTLQGV
jgi:hypothetical protein